MSTMDLRQPERIRTEPIAPSDLAAATRKLATLVLYTLSAAATLATLLFVLAAETLSIDGPGALRILYPVMGVPTAALVAYTLRRRRRMRMSRAPGPSDRVLARYLWLLALGGLACTSFVAAPIVFSQSASGALALVALGFVLPVWLIWRGTSPSSASKNLAAPALVRTEEGARPEPRVFERSPGGLIMTVLGAAVMILFLPASIGLVALGAVLASRGFLLGAVAAAALGLLLTASTILLAFKGYGLVRDRRRPFIILDQFGVHLLLPKNVVIPWDEISSVGVFCIRGRPILQLGLIHPERFLDPFSRLFTKSYLCGLGIAADPPSVIVDAIQAHPRYSSK
jgi:hypothetical protein